MVSHADCISPELPFAVYFAEVFFIFGRPHESLRSLIMVLDVIVERADELIYAVNVAAPHALVGDIAEPSCDQI